MDSIGDTAADLRIAVIIPVLGDAAGLARVSADLAKQSRKPDEIIVVSGAPDAAVAAVADRDGLNLVHSRASRGLQLDTGAAETATAADILWFVHADAHLPQDACSSVVAAVSRGAAGGCLRFRFAGRRSVVKRVLERLIRIRIACGGIAYGDQALFCTRQAYASSGGFPHQQLFEEVRVVRHLQRTRGFVTLDTPVYVSCRRWERDGWMRRTLHNRWLALRHTLGARPEALARAYRASLPGNPDRAADRNATETQG